MDILEREVKSPWIFFGTIIVIVALLLVLALQLQLDASIDSMAPKEGEYATSDKLLTSSFDNGDTLEIILKRNKESIIQDTVMNIEDPRVTEYVQRVSALLLESQYVDSVSDVQFAAGVDVARFFVTVHTPDVVGGSSQVKDELEFYMDQLRPPPGIDAQLTGMPLLIDKIGSLLIEDNLITLMLTFIFIFLFLFWYFKNLRFVVAVMLSPVISLIALAAIMVLLNIHVTIPLAAVGVLVLGLGVDYSLHITIHYKHKMAEGKTHLQAIKDTIKELQLPITASFLTTLAGFASLMFGVSASSQDQGMVLAVAITVIYAVSFVIFPIFLTVLTRGAPITENTLFRRIREALAKLAVFQARRPWTVMIVFAIITAVMVMGMMKVEFSTSNSNWIPDSDPVSVSFREDAYAFGDTDQILVLLQSTEGDLRNVHTARDVKELSADLRSLTYVDSVSSVYDVVGLDQAELYQLLTYAPEMQGMFNDDYTVSVIRLTTSNLDEDVAGKSRVLADIRQLVKLHPIYHTEVYYYGDPVRFEELQDSMQSDAGKTTMMGIALVFLIASIIYASFAVGLVALIPIIIGLIWAVGLMGFLGVPFTSLSTGIVSLVLGIGIDFSIHLVDGIKRFLKTHPLEEALTQTLVSSGTSILLSSMTTFIGFMALSFSQLLGTQRLGWSLAIAVFAVFVVSILTVPAIMKLTTKTVKQHE